MNATRPVYFTKRKQALAIWTSGAFSAFAAAWWSVDGFTGWVVMDILLAIVLLAMARWPPDGAKPIWTDVPARERIMDCLREHPDQTCLEVAVAIRMWSISVWSILAVLEDRGIVEAKFLDGKYPRRRVYRLKVTHPLPEEKP